MRPLDSTVVLLVSDVSHSIVKNDRLKKENVESSLYYNEIALLRKYTNNSKKETSFHILNSREFNSLFAMRQNDSEWRKIVYIRSNVKAKIGIGNKVSIGLSIKRGQR